MVFTIHFKRLLPRVLVMLAALCGGLQTVAMAAEAHIAVAANFTAPMRALVHQFSMQSPHKIRVVTGSTGKLYSQIFHGAPFDAFLSADQTTVARLNQGGLTVANSTFTYAEGRLIFWRRSDNRMNGGGGDNNRPPWEAIKRGDFSHIAIANPKLAPFGHAAVEVLQRAGVYEVAQRALVYGESVTQAHQFVAAGAADAGFISLSQVWRDGQLINGQGWIVPARWHDPVRQDAVLLKRGAGNQAAIAFMAFLKTAAAKRTLVQFGYIE
jgi:molybdate transport system substrate-binding protein